ncbi:hypothetical protein TTHERM_00717810 (macronuclear) [Tetrahymena thermophila SB210]|uniref:Uncharacterized protein n=1 Tax=Tetrahymena thermophila (strain SB210) TaxID=312017 RepID=Q23E98_TETTS|nr:hypothetical protein TTHERM_00717810 [Tetrahymena thermophila SB210]EAR94855.2 hypothetical protein TTHERM_00717810 [Tetrahymena thermophila SB210]|eukprot:XP_001015100.2 hypothetical protein TTHERM_00717810 [Tetrahymena thermophila SB210]
MNNKIQKIIQQFNYIQQYDPKQFQSQILAQINSASCLIQQDEMRNNNNNNDYNDDNDTNQSPSLRLLINSVQELYTLLNQAHKKNEQQLLQQQISQNIVFIKDPNCFNSPQQAHQEQIQSSLIKKQNIFIDNNEEYQLRSQENIEDCECEENQQTTQLKNSAVDQYLQKNNNEKESNSRQKQADIIIIESDNENQDEDKTINYNSSQKIRNNRFFQSKIQNKQGLSQICQNKNILQEQFQEEDIEEQQFKTTVYVGSAYHMKNNSVYFYKIYNDNINYQDSFKYYYFEEDLEQERLFDIVILMLKKIANYNISQINLKYSLGEQNLVLKKIFDKDSTYKQEIYNQKKKQIFDIIKTNKIDFFEDKPTSEREFTEIYFECLQEIKKWPNQANQIQKSQTKLGDVKEKENPEIDNFIFVDQEYSKELYLQNQLKEYQHCIKTKQKIPSNNPYLLLKQLNKDKGYDSNNFLDSSPYSDMVSQNSTPQNNKYLTKRKLVIQIDSAEQISDSSSPTYKTNFSQKKRK